MKQRFDRRWDLTSTPVPEGLGAFLKDWRRRNGVRQRDLAKKLGIPSSSLSSIEIGKRRRMGQSSKQALDRIIQFAREHGWKEDKPYDVDRTG